jgi:hypothetical protein
MAFTWGPAIQYGETLYKLPQPVDVLRWVDRPDFRQFKTPLVDGDEALGFSDGPVVIEVEGRIARTGEGVLLPTLETMFGELVNLRTAVKGDASNDREYWFYIIYGDGGGTVRCFKQCYTLSFLADLSDPTTIGYALSLKAKDVTLYTS